MMLNYGAVCSALIPDERSRVVLVCQLCAGWQLDIGAHESTEVVESIVGAHVLHAHGMRTHEAVAAELHRRDVERAEARVLPWRELQAALDDWGSSSDLARAVLMLHAPDFGLGSIPSVPDCQACGLDGSEYPYSWPCATVAVVVGIEGSQFDDLVRACEPSYDPGPSVAEIVAAVKR